MLETILKNKLQNATRVAVLGVGSELRGDDVAGILAAQQIEKNTLPEVAVFIGETAPENFTGEIKKFKPTHLIIIDAAELNTKPGCVRVLNLDEISGTSFCTHSLPIKVMVDYLLKSLKFEIITIGIQPKTLTFGAQPTKEVVAAAKKLARTITKLLK